MTGDPLTQHALGLLARGHYLYGGNHPDAGLAEAPEQFRRRAERLISVTTHDGMGAAAGRVLDDARHDSIPTADTPLGRQEALRRMAARLRIPATFAHYHQPGTSANIYDPVANICASMNYVIHRYSVSLNGENLAFVVQQADAHRPPKGY